MENTPTLAPAPIPINKVAIPFKPRSGYKLKNGFTFGSDPEFFLYDTSKQDFVRASRYFSGTKKNPEPIGYGNFLQADGMALEINTNPTSSDLDFDSYVVFCLAEAVKRMPPSVIICTNPSVTFSEREWDETPDEDKILGCSPDMNAWEQSVNSPPQVDENSRLRTLGGHVHVGWTEDASPADFDHFKNCVEFVQQLDYYLGAWSLKYDKDKSRRALYGKAGSCRIKPYGVEYRVLSSFWCDTRQGRREVFSRASKAITAMSDNFFPESTGKSIHNSGITFNELVIQSINSGVNKRDLTRYMSEIGV